MENKEELQQNEIIQEEQVQDIAEEKLEDITIPLDTEEPNQEEVQEDVQEESTEADNEPLDELSNLSKADQVEMLVQKAKIIVDEADTTLKDCQASVNIDLETYASIKETLKNTIVDINNDLLIQLEHTENQLEELEAQEEGEQYQEELQTLEDIEKNIDVLKTEDFEEAPLYEPKDTLTPMYVQEPSSGGFGAFITGLIGGGATLAGMAYFASTKLGIKLDPSKLPSMETCKPVFEYYAQLLKQSNPNIGMALMGGSAFLVFLILYKMKKSSKATKNLEFAKQQLQNAEEYVSNKTECKMTMDAIDNHIKEHIDTFKLCDVILKEQQAKLNRIIYIEADNIQNGNLHDKSIKEIEDTREIIECVKEDLSTPLTDEDNRLSQDSLNALQALKDKLDKIISRLY